MQLENNTIMTEQQCLYCENKTTEDNKHFISTCCGRGMCEDCFINLQGTEEQIQLANFDTEPEDEEILTKCGWNNADYICFKCFENWTYYVKQQIT